MPFKQIFEGKVNDNMQEDSQPGRAPPEGSEDIKKMPAPGGVELEDAELHQKKDSPPRFSTLFSSSPPPQPEPARHYIQEYYACPERRPGVFIPTPLFVIFAVILFFESTILFAYTVIGLYNNAPSRLLPWAGPGVATACDCGPKEQPAVNFAPNFIMAGAQPISLSPQPELLPTLTSSTSTSTSTSSATSTTSTTSSSSTTSTTTSTSSTTPTPSQTTIFSLKLVTSYASFSQSPTTTVFMTVDPTATA